MNIYVDFDDCLCETARSFSRIAAELFDIDVPYENMQYFDLQKTFDLTQDQYREIMIKGHLPEVLLSYEETSGASDAINDLLDEGHEVMVITGRPYSAYEPSRMWLDQHGLERVNLYCLDKYGRDVFYKDSVFALKLEDFYNMKFDYAIEDSPSAFRFFGHLPKLNVMVFDRPWNRECQLPGENYRRFADWESIRTQIMQ